MDNKNRLEGKRILIVDDEADVLETLEDLLTQYDVSSASSFEAAKKLLETETFDFAVLDIMGVDGYELLKVATDRDVTAVMLTANALTPEDVKKSFRQGAAFYVPKEEMLNIETFLIDILEAKEKGKSPWGRWYERLASFCERKFGPDWQADDKAFWEKFPFY
jgi:DNA-binding NtrC family response regulator